VCGRNTHWGLSWLCLWLLMGGSAALLLNSSPFLRVSLICSVSVNTQISAWKYPTMHCRQHTHRLVKHSWKCSVYSFVPLGLGIPLSESLRGCDPMQMDRLSSSSSGGRLRSSHTHLALTPLRLEPSVSIPWSTLSCLDEQEIYAIINTSSRKTHKRLTFSEILTQHAFFCVNRGH